MHRRIALRLITMVAVVITIMVSYALLPKTYVQVSIGELTLSAPIPCSIVGATLTAVAIAIELLPLSITEYRLWRVNNELFMDIPAVIRVLRDGLGSGQSLVGVAGILTRIGKGRLGGIIAEAITKEGMGITTMKGSLIEASKELGNNYLAMLAVVLDMAIKSGARLQETLDMAYRSFEDMVSYQLEKSNEVKPYLALIYVVMAIYIVLAGIIIYLMMPSMSRITITTSAGVITAPTISTVDTQLFSSIIVMSSVIQSIIAGVIIGRIVYGKPLVGLLHASILITVLTLMNYIMYLVIYLGTA